MNLPILFDKSNIPERAAHVWGIDLGTTNSAVAEIRWPSIHGFEQAPVSRCLELEQPTTEGIYTSPLVPSVVAVLPEGHWVGEGAKRLRARLQEKGLIFEKTLFYDTKNEMGLRKTYHQAAHGCNHASKIAGHILQFLKQQAEQVSGSAPNRIVVTVPASFQLNQRQDTLAAAYQAGLQLQEFDLLDEPTAALIDYLVSHPDAELLQTHQSRVLVLDFGGGTCDVAIVQIERHAGSGRLQMSPLAVSRYHRLGGSDLDAAIVHEHLIPQLLRENGLGSRDLGWAEKKKGLEPQLLGTAEALKIALCKEVDRLQKFGKFEAADKSTIQARQPGLVITLGKREYRLTQPALSAHEWEKLLEPFLDVDHLFARETEYRLAQSIFAPLQDTLMRAKLEPREIDFCLLVGGSSLIPHVRSAIGNYFRDAHVCTYEDSLAAQTAVAKGASWHALHLAVIQRPLIQPVLSDTIALLTGKDEPYPLITSNTPVPFPADGSYAKLDNLAVPQTLARSLKIGVVALPAKQLIFEQHWHLNQIVNAGDPITFKYRLSSNYKLECHACLTNQPECEFTHSVENPLCHVVNPGSIRLRIEELEEELRKVVDKKEEHAEKFVELAENYAELGQRERAIDILRAAMLLYNRPDAGILNLQANYFGELGDFIRQDKAYGEADAAAPTWGGAMFNLSLSLRRRNKHLEALAAIDKALKKEPGDGPYMTQRGLCLRSLQMPDEAQETFKMAIVAFDPPAALTDWELGWFKTCASVLEDKQKLEAAEQEQKRRQNKQITHSDDDFLRPVIKGHLVRRAQ